MKKISSFKIKNKLFQIYINKNKKYLRKIFINTKEKKNYLNEINGYKIFRKKKFFQTVKFCKKGTTSKGYFIDLEFIDGTRPNFFDVKKIYKLKKKNYEKENIIKYLKRIKKNYSTQNILIKKNINDFILHFKKKKDFKVLISHTHGDFAMYNCKKFKNKYYVFDLEKYSKRIHIFDIINWLVHPFFYNFSKIFEVEYLKIFKSFILKINFFFIYLIYASIFILYNVKFSINEFKVYYFLYLIEKYLICETDLYKIKNIKEKKRIRNFIFIVETYINKLVKEYN